MRNSENRKQQIRRRQKKRRREGFCRNCANRTVRIGSVLCQKCLDYGIHRRQRLANSGLCAICGQSSRLENRATCEPCLIQRKFRNLRRHGLSETELRAAKRTASQHDGLCQCCGEHCGDMCMDHDHNTLRFRGILGHRCNKVLGLVKDDILVLEKMIRYLRKLGGRP